MNSERPLNPICICYCVFQRLHTFSLSPICITIDNRRIPVELYKIYVGVTPYTVLRYIFIDYLPWVMCLLSSCLNANAIFHNIILRIRPYTFTFENRSQHHAKRALKPLGTIALLSSIICRLSETSVSGSFKLTLPPPFSTVILWSSTREEKGQKKIDLSRLSGKNFLERRKHTIYIT